MEPSFTPVVQLGKADQEKAKLFPAEREFIRIINSQAFKLCQEGKAQKGMPDLQAL